MAGSDRVVGRQWSQTGDDAFRALVEEFGRVVDDLEALRANVERSNTGVLLSAPALKVGTTDAEKLRNEAFTFRLRGSGELEKAASEVSIGTDTVADQKERSYTVSIQSGGTIVVTVSSETDIGESVRPAAPVSELVIGWFKVVNESGGTFTGNTTALDAEDVTTTFEDASLMAESALTAAKVTTREAGSP